MKKMIFDASVVANEQIANQILRMRLYHPGLATGAHPGQFVQVRVPHCPEVFWRRPFSIHNTNPDQGTFDLLFNIVGQGTRVLSRVQPGDMLQCLGPLGNSFTFAADLKEAIIVAGGLGIAPFAFLINQLPRNAEIKVFYGAATIASLYQFQVTRRVKWNVSTDDGSAGEKGVVTDLLEKELAEPKPNRMIFACGPAAMLKRTAELAAQFEVPAQVSVETVMGCGFGACMGCVVRLKQPQPEREYVLACKDGPVFNIQDIEIPHD